MSLHELNVKCLVCQKEFKTNRGLSRHNNTICKLNELSIEQKKIPTSIIDKIKDDIVYLIHRRLGKNSKNTSLQAVSLTCPQSIFQVIFKGYIHYYNKWTGVFKCIFCESTGYQELSNILNNINWGVKYYLQNQKTYVQLASPHDLSQDQHPLIRRAKEKAAIAAAKNSRKRVRKSRYPCGEVIIEWREKKDIDTRNNICQAGFIFIHFFTAKKHFWNWREYNT